MTTSRVAQLPGLHIKNTVPNREIELALTTREIGLVQSGKDCAWIAAIDMSNPARSQNVKDRNRKQGGFNPMTRDVEQIESEMLSVKPMIPETIAAEVGRRGHAPVSSNWAFGQRPRKQRENIFRSPCQLSIQSILTLLQCSVSLLKLTRPLLALFPQGLKPEMSVDAGFNLFELERLADVVNASTVKCLDLIDSLVKRAQENDGHFSRLIISL